MAKVLSKKRRLLNESAFNPCVVLDKLLLYYM